MNAQTQNQISELLTPNGWILDTEAAGGGGVTYAKAVDGSSNAWQVLIVTTHWAAGFVGKAESLAECFALVRAWGCSARHGRREAHPWRAGNFVNAALLAAEIDAKRWRRFASVGA